MYYLSIWFIYFIYAFKQLFIKASYKKITISILFIISTIFAGVRYYMGTDYNNYYLLFETMTDPKLIPHYEIGFLYGVHLLKKIGLNSFQIFFFISVISFWFIKKGICINSKSIGISLMIYFSIFMIPFNFNAIGQGIIIGIFLYSIEMMKNKETKKIILITLIASLIHTSGIIIIISYIVYRLNLQMKNILILSIIATIVLFINRIIGAVIIKILPAFISERFYSYFSIINMPVDLVSVGQRLLIMILILIFAYQNIDEHNKKILQIYVLGFLLYALFAGNRLFATRINLGFRVLEVILLPNIMFFMKKKEYKLGIFLIISLLSILVLVSNFSNENIYPYRHLWSKW